MNEDKKYNGWTNYETWLCNLHYDDYFSEAAREAYDNAESDGAFTREENAALSLKDHIESTVEDLTQESLNGAPGGFVADLVSAALREINYYEIAQHYIIDVDKTEEEVA